MRLKYLAGINERSLPEQTDPEQRIRYIDISLVGYGYLVGEPKELRFKDAPSSARRLVRDGDTIISTVRAYLRAVWQVDGETDDLVVSTGFAVLTPMQIEPRFFSWWVRSDRFIEEMVARSVGVLYPTVSALELGDLQVRMPATSEQRAIADYLDIETARIDALITKKRRLIDLLNERRRIWAEGVLLEVKDEVPVVRLKHLVTESDDRLGSSFGPLVLSVSIHLGVVPREDMSDKESRADNFTNYKVCRPGDIAINRMRAFQGGVGIVRHLGVVSPDYTVLTVGPKLRGGYLHYAMRTPWFVSEMTRRLRGIGSTDQGNVRTPRINFADLGLIEIPVPSMDWQADFERAAQTNDGAVQTVVKRLEQQVRLLAERRQALITAAVTGKLEIPEVAA